MKKMITLSTGIIVHIITSQADYGAQQLLEDLKEVLPKYNLHIADFASDGDFAYYIAHRELSGSELLQLQKKYYSGKL